ncbi:MAG: hypothetical protein JNM52_03100 [Betaproteobacteria bacterium]|nr:hypothetical protein [Betaproteobacteria bacterium]
MTARDIEAALLVRCAATARAVIPIAEDPREANVFRLAAIVIRTQFPRESECLMRSSELYFAAHPREKLVAAEVVRQGWISSLPRLRHLLSQQLHRR